MPDKLEFASDAWVDLAEAVLASAVRAAGDTIAGQRLTVSETFLRPPAHLRKGDADEVAWAFTIDDRTSRVVRHAVADADFAMRVDYQGALPGGRAVLGTTLADIEARNVARREAIASGRVQATGGLDHVTLPMRLVLLDLHNRLAEATA